MKNFVYEIYNEEHYNRFIEELKEFCNSNSNKVAENILTEFFKHEERLYNTHMTKIKEFLNKGYNVYLVLHTTNRHKFMQPFGYTTEDSEPIISCINPLDKVYFFTLKDGLNNTQPIILRPDNVKEIITRINEIETNLNIIKEELGVEVPNYGKE